MMTAARLLTRADSDNAMAWLTLGYAADQSLANPEEISSALNHASAASRFHDYGFDLMKQAAIATGEVPIPDDVRGQESPEQLRMQFMNPVVSSSTVVGWLRQGCNATNAVPPPALGPCTKAKELLQRGDSLETLSGNREAISEMNANRSGTHASDQAAYAKAFIESVLESNNEREWLGDMKNKLEP